MTSRWTGIGAGVLLGMLLAAPVRGQAMRFGNHREITPPDYATVRIGPFYSTIAFSQLFGYRYSQASGAGVDYLQNEGLGVYQKDGSEFPLISTLTFRNYLIISRNADLDMSIRLRYETYPLGTQEDEFRVDLAEEGIEGSLSTEYRLTSSVRGRLYDRMYYSTDYIDTRGIEDEYGGSKYTYFRNRIGTENDWLVGKGKGAGLELYREDNIPTGSDFDNQERVTYGEVAYYEQEVFPSFVMGIRAGFFQDQYASDTRADSDRSTLDFYARLDRDEDAGARFRLTDASTLTATLGLSTYYEGSVRAAAGDASPTNTSGNAQTVTGEARVRTLLTENLTHEYYYQRGLRGGFDSGFEEYDAYGYDLRWRNSFASTRFYTRILRSEPSGGRADYRDWDTGLDASYPLMRGVALNFSTVYTQRDNSGADDDTTVDLAERSDYSTWRSRLGTAFKVTRRTDFTTYVQHVERYSDASELEYTRDIFGAYFRYFHQL